MSGVTPMAQSVPEAFADLGEHERVFIERLGRIDAARRSQCEHDPVVEPKSGITICARCGRGMLKAQSALSPNWNVVGPELLEALIRVVAVADRKTDDFDAARAAIAKAEGRS